MPVSESHDPAPEQDPAAPPTALEIPVEAMPNQDGSARTAFEPPIPAPMPDELSVPPIPSADATAGLSEVPGVDYAGVAPSPEAFFDSFIPERPMQAVRDSVPNAPVPAIPPSPVRSFFEQGIER